MIYNLLLHRIRAKKRHTPVSMAVAPRCARRHRPELSGTPLQRRGGCHWLALIKHVSNSSIIGWLAR